MNMYKLSNSKTNYDAIVKRFKIQAVIKIDCHCNPNE